jgi:hypothetical protein
MVVVVLSVFDENKDLATFLCSLKSEINITRMGDCKLAIDSMMSVCA